MAFQFMYTLREPVPLLIQFWRRGKMLGSIGANYVGNLDEKGILLDH